MLHPKVAGTRALLSALEPDDPEFIVLCSSMAALTGNVGQVDYAAANAYLDAAAHAASAQGRRVVSINWDAWREVGMAVETVTPASIRHQRLEALGSGISPERGAAALFRVLACGLTHVIASPVGLSVRLAEADAVAAGLAAGALTAVTRHPRPSLGTEYEAPRTPAERRLAVIWEDLLGVNGVGVHDNFFELGGDSLLSTQLIARLQRAFGRDCSLREVTECASIAALAALVEREPVSAVIDPHAELVRELSGLSEEEAASRLRALSNDRETQR